MLDLLYNWNRWGNNPLDSGYPRTITKHISQYIDMPETIALIGLRRVGKSTVIYQIMDHLEQKGVNQTSRDVNI
jgi:predicted AAA+ superfamily ATPase